MQPDQTTTEFLVDARWNAGGVPPPHFCAYRVRIAADGTGRVDFWSDRDLDSPPAWSRPFQTEPARLDGLRAMIAGFDASDLRPPAEPHVGGQHLDLVIRTDSGDVTLSSDVHPDDLHRVAALFRAIRACMPADLRHRLPEWGTGPHHDREDEEGSPAGFGHGPPLVG